MPIKPWDEWDWTPEEFVVFSTKNGNPMFVFSIGRLPDIRYDEGCSVHDAFLRMYREAVWGYLEQHNYKGEKFNIDLCFKYGLSNAQKERCYADTSEVRQLLQENAYRIKALLEKVCRDNAETCNELDGIANAEVDLASVERPIRNDNNFPSTWIYAKDKDVEKTQSNNDTAMASLGLQSSIFTAIQDGNEIAREGFAMVVEEIRQAVKSAEQTPPPSLEQPQDVNNQIDGDNTSEETDDEWGLVVDWAKKHSNGSTKKQGEILRRIRNARGTRKEKSTGEYYKGHEIFKDSEERRFYKGEGKDRVYNWNDLENDKEKIIPKDQNKKH